MILLGELGKVLLPGELGKEERLPAATDVNPIVFILRIGGGARRDFNPRVFFTLLVTTIIPVPPLGPTTAGGVGEDETSTISSLISMVTPPPLLPPLLPKAGDDDRLHMKKISYAVSRSSEWWRVSRRMQKGQSISLSPEETEVSDKEEREMEDMEAARRPMAVGGGVRKKAGNLPKACCLRRANEVVVR